MLGLTETVCSSDPPIFLQVTLHAHTAREVGHISALISVVNRKTGEATKSRPRCASKQGSQGRPIARRITTVTGCRVQQRSQPMGLRVKCVLIEHNSSLACPTSSFTPRPKVPGQGPGCHSGGHRRPLAGAGGVLGLQGTWAHCIERGGADRGGGHCDQDFRVRAVRRELTRSVLWNGADMEPKKIWKRMDHLWSPAIFSSCNS